MVLESGRVVGYSGDKVKTIYNVHLTESLKFCVKINREKKNGNFIE